jgi:hypothetical protein
MCDAHFGPAEKNVREFLLSAKEQKTVDQKAYSTPSSKKSGD